MSAYKKLNKQDAYITTYTAQKSWVVSGSDFAAYGITSQVVGEVKTVKPEIQEGTPSQTQRGNPTLSVDYLSSLRHLYYPNKQSVVTVNTIACSGSVATSLVEIVSHSYDYYPQTTLNFPQARQLSTGNYMYSIPRDLYGTHLQPGVDIELVYTQLQKSLYVANGYWSSSYTDESQFQLDTTEFNIKDDGEGNLYIDGTSPRDYIGDIIYPHGLIIITDAGVARALNDKQPDTISFKSSHPIFTHNYHCRIRESEFNYTYNPTSLSGSIKTTYYNDGTAYKVCGKVDNGDRKDNITGSAFQPYITTVGLYNDANELIAVGKLSQPTPKPVNTEMTIIIKIDI
mgnify:FL=1